MHPPASIMETRTGPFSFTGAGDPPAPPGAANVCTHAGSACVDGEALGRVYHTCCAALFRFLMVRTGNDRALCDDLMQTLWVKASQGCGGVPEAELEIWLRTVARNLLVTHMRKEGAARRNLPRADARLALELAEGVEQGAFPFDALKRQEARDQLLLAMTALPAEEQDLLVAHYVRGEQQAAIAARVGAPVRGIEAKLYRARKALRERLTDMREETA